MTLQDEAPMTPLERITERVNRLGNINDPETPRPLLSVEEFFDGNTHPGTIGCNLENAPSPEQFHALFKAMAQRPDVHDIRVQITMFDDPEWPFSDAVYIMTSASPEEVFSWFPDELQPGGTWEGFPEGQAFEPYAVPPGARPIACWWD
jgi:hypothetical protein